MRTRLVKTYSGQTFILAARVSADHLWLNPKKVKKVKKSLWN